MKRVLWHTTTPEYAALLRQSGTHGQKPRGRNTTGTDHLSFLAYGVPGFNFDQLTRGYNHTHHSQVDTYDHALPDDVAQAATVMAATAYELANLPQLLPRGQRRANN